MGGSLSKRELFKHGARQTPLVHSCGAERALNLSEAVISSRLHPGGTPLIKPTDCILY